ncbi:FTR1 family protein [Microbulbifer rhizosphaerae]|uniref:High-affinity iron transporter n=1 Tax=Microbulbifer rhizosphaerae TaxID=1562603 RepID=A0A7W4WDW7_9GAMM|nr:FTR1 family protein [Microbulbifer rhizosphaerae]MBB3062449.1 high-affinity iron transporter [Microbulbifer rhizosphaerae]
MLLTSVIIILREVLEAALLLSILLAMSHLLHLRLRWFYIALAAGAAGSVAYGMQLAAISDAFDGVGQELLNAALQIAIYLLLLVIAPLLVVNYYTGERYRGILSAAMTVAVATAVLREGSEVFIYLSAFRYSPQPWSGVLTGALLGAGIGFSVGALFYYLLVGMPRRRALLVTCVLLTLAAGGMVLQATQLLIQADWLPAQVPLWNSSVLVAEGSLTGQMMYALVGYEATPTSFQVIIYSASVATMALLLLLTRYHQKKIRTVRDVSQAR